jgi:DNA-binding MarR family transcriptional regulator
VLDAIRKIVQALRRSSRQAEQSHGLSGAQLFVLRQLAERDTAITLGEVAAATLTHPSSVSVVVSRLVQRGLVLRHPSTVDARRVEVRLSAKGRDFLERKAPVTAQERLADAVARMPTESRALLADLLGTLLLDAGLDTEEAAMFFEDGSDQETP